MRRLMVTAIVLLAAAAAGISGWAYRAFTTAGPLESAAAFVIPKGLGVDGIAAVLLKDGVIRDARTFSFAVELLGERRALRAGEYLFPANASLRDAIDVLLHAKPVMRHLTVAEGLTNAQVIDLLTHADGLEGAVKESLEEGTLLPQTYNYSWGDGRDDMLARMRKAMSETLDQLWKDRAPDLELHSEEEALTLASIVEKETAKPD
ncbi:MAG TPA: endolytic transglycosylase MltG, partial [Alphaproteobacteria bacterium]